MVFFVILVVVVLSFGACNSFARLAGHLVITAVQIEGKDGASDEFIEIYNPTEHIFDAKELSLKIRKTTKKLHYKTEFIPPYSFYLLVSDKFSGSGGDATFTAGLGESSCIELSYGNNLVDKLGWCENVEAEGTSCASPKKDKIIQRREIFLDTDNNKADKYTCQSGDTITYTLSVKNNDKITLNNVVVVDELPRQTYLVAVGAPNCSIQYYVGERWQHEFSYHATKVKIIIPQFPPNATLTFSIKVKVY